MLRVLFSPIQMGECQNFAEICLSGFMSDKYKEKENIDSVKMMRKIGERSAIIYKNLQVEEKELEQIRKNIQK